MADLIVSGNVQATGSVIASQNLQAGNDAFVSNNIGVAKDVNAGGSVIASKNLQAGHDLYASVDAVAGRNVTSTGQPTNLGGTVVGKLFLDPGSVAHQPGLKLRGTDGLDYVLYVAIDPATGYACLHLTTITPKK